MGYKTCIDKNHLHLQTKPRTKSNYYFHLVLDSCERYVRHHATKRRFFYTYVFFPPKGSTSVGAALKKLGEENTKVNLCVQHTFQAQSACLLSHTESRRMEL